MKTTIQLSSSHVVLALLIAAGCSQGKEEGSEPASTTPAPLASSVAPTSTAVAMASASHDWGDDPTEIPKERFTNGEAAFNAVRTHLKDQYYADGLTDDDLYRAATAGMLERIDPRMRKWNKLLSPHELEEMKTDLKGEIVGAGIQIDFDPATGYIAVSGVYHGGAAERAGIVPGDTIVRVNDKLYKGMKIRDVVGDIRGKAGDPVSFSVLHDGKLDVVKIVRERVVFDTPDHSVLLGSVGYVRIPSFTERTHDAVQAALNDLASKKVTGLVLDVRQNQGGLFQEAVHTAELFVPAGAEILSTKKRKEGTEKMVSKGTPILGDVPIVILKDAKTASGGELLGAALRDTRKARTVGVRTMGKGSVQMLDDLPNGYAYKYTLSLLYTPSGQTFDGVGLTPDIEVALDDVSRGKAMSAPTEEARLALDVQLKTAAELLRR